MDEPSGRLALHIASGMHQGGSAHIQENVAYRIGADVDGDIVMRDEGIAACHVILEVSAGRARLRAMADAVRMDGTRPLPPGHVAACRLPCRFSLGNVDLCLARETPPGLTGKGQPWGRRLRAGAWPLALASLTVLAGWLLLPGTGGARDVQADTLAAAVPDRPAAPSARDLREALQAQLRAAGLQGIAVSVEGSLVRVQGVLPAPLRPQWQTVQEWFDRRYGSHYVLRSTLAEAVAPRIAITAVWLGEQPYVVDADGERHSPGALLGDGWVLQRIAPGRIVLVRDGQEHVFDL